MNTLLTVALTSVIASVISGFIGLLFGNFKSRDNGNRRSKNNKK